MKFEQLHRLEDLKQKGTLTQGEAFELHELLKVSEKVEKETVSSAPVAEVKVEAKHKRKKAVK